MTDGSADPNHQQRRSEAFFGRRKSKGLSPAQVERFEVLLPKLRLDPNSPKVADAKSLFPHSPENVILEIGFGGGEHLIHQATSNPNNGYIGVEPFVNSMAKALACIEEGELQNIRLYDEDAVEVLDWLPEASIDRVDLLYPDPWPKVRHWKRRFINQANLTRFARVLKPGGKFHFASDIDTYVHWTLKHCERHPSFENQAVSQAEQSAPYENWIRTRYEAKAIREGRSPNYLRFGRK